eukprot:TRINITY_DN1500_c0_g1_i5.p1 TRINITY_DN1500_c0_g1~~TRINITY_DN1500_c0_g1_i5.p1  ORF type:complete len:118 (-),score=20.08 TRINITY_DN1500_c0_g1_i5:151-504(-)
MFVLVILGVAAVAKSVPVEPSKKVTDDATLMKNLQQAILVEDVEDGYGRRRRSTPSEDHFRSHLEEGYGRRRRSPQTTQSQVLPLTGIESQDDQIAVETESRVFCIKHCKYPEDCWS